MGQQLPQITLRQNNLLLHNPAVAGSTTSKEIKLLHREQWAGFDNAPFTSIISYHQELSTSAGIGGYIINDVTSPTSRFIINASYAYIIDMDELFLSFGLSAQVMQYRFKSNELTYRENIDPVMEMSNERKWRPEANFGMFLYNNRFYAGFSLNQIIQTNFQPYSAGDFGEIQMSRHMYVMGQYDMYFGMHKISPAIFIGYAKKSPVSTEISANYWYDNSIYSSIGYRYDDAISISVGYRYNRWFLAYSYDIVTSPLRHVNSGSHEISMCFDIAKEIASAPSFSSESSSSRKYRKSAKRLF